MYVIINIEVEGNIKTEREEHTMKHTITFDYKGQMINYYNKIKNNMRIESIWFWFDASTGKYILTYSYFNK